MHPTSLGVENFGSFANGEYAFSPGLFLIEGLNEDKEGSSNGSGKSIFFVDALVWVLYDTTCRGIRHDDVIQKGCPYVKVQLTLQHNDTQITIFRKKERGKGSQVFLGDSRATQEQIERVVGMDYNTFTASIVHAQQFRGFAERAEPEQKAILTTLLGLEEWDVYRTNVGVKIRELNNQLLEADVLRRTYEARLSQVKNAGDLETKSREFERDRKQKLQETRKSIEDKEKELTSLQVADDTELRKEQKKWENARVNLVRRRNDERARLKEATREVNVIHGDLKVVTYELERLYKEKEQLDTLVGVCPTCRQPITETHKERCGKKCDIEIRELEEKGEQIISAYEKARSKERRQEGEVIAVDQQLTQAEGALFVINEKLHEITTAQQVKTSKEEALQGARTLYEELTNMKNPHSELIRENAKESADLQTKLKELATAIFGAQEELRYAEFWDEGFSNKGIKSYIFDAIIPEFTEKANAYIQLLTNQPIRIQFDTQREKKTGGLSEKLTIKLLDNAGERPYVAWSGGEKKRIAVAIDLALSDLVLLRSRVCWDFVLFDECFDGLDEEGKEMMIYLLEEIMKIRERVYVISHDSTMRGMIDNRVLVKKNKGVSYFA